MCWVSGKKVNYRKVNHPVPVFKVVYTNDTTEVYSGVFHHKYVLDEISPKIKLRKKKCGTDENCYYRIDAGYHSYTQNLTVSKREMVGNNYGVRVNGMGAGHFYPPLSYRGLKIGIFEIPAGSKFITNEYGEIVSERIVLKKVVSVDYFIKNGILA